MSFSKNLIENLTSKGVKLYISATYHQIKDFKEAPPDKEQVDCEYVDVEPDVHYFDENGVGRFHILPNMHVVAHGGEKLVWNEELQSKVSKQLKELGYIVDEFKV
jgi:hypothetical protein